jgi:hypothetical protein
VGDSFVESLGVPFRETVWARLERETGACIHVAGVGGYRLGQYLKLTRDRLSSASRPYDLVILSLYVGNDFTPDAEYIPPPQEVQRLPFRWLPAGLSQKELWKWFYPMNSWLEMRSHAYVALRQAVRRLWNPLGLGTFNVPHVLRRSGLSDKHLDETERGVRLIAEEVLGARSELLVVLVPMRIQVLDPQGEQLAREFPRARGDLDMDLVKREFAPRLSAISGIEVLDLLDPLRAGADRAWWGSDGHFSPEGHEVWFGLLREPVARLLTR